MKKKLKAGDFILGATMNFVSPEVVELVALAGFDYILFDGEHGPVDPSNLTPSVCAAERRGLTALARPPVNEPHVVLRFMDLGIHGLLMPHIDSAELATAAVKAIHYAPKGERGQGIVRANDWGAIPSAEYLKQASEESLVLGLIESMEGVDDLERIVEVEGFDVVWIGASDLAQSMGMRGESSKPADVARVVERVIRTAHKAGKWVGTGVTEASDIPRYRDMGASCFSMQVRRLIVNGGRDYIAEARGHLKKQESAA
jgi:4-hydroxy-2-oxoheptanedioate aldolase